MILRALVFLLCGCGATSGTLLRPSDRAPDFSAQDQSGATRTLSEFRGKNVVLYFYPRDGSPGCTEEACAFRDAWDRLREAGGEVIGVSMDSVESHREFAEEHELEFPLLADPDGRILRAYGVSSAMGMSARVTFVIDGSGVVRRVFRDVDPAIHVDEVTEVLESLRRVSAPRPRGG